MPDGRTGHQQNDPSGRIRLGGHLSVQPRDERDDGGGRPRNHESNRRGRQHRVRQGGREIDGEERGADTARQTAGRVGEIHRGGGFLRSRADVHHPVHQRLVFPPRASGAGTGPIGAYRGGHHRRSHHADEDMDANYLRHPVAAREHEAHAPGRGARELEPLVRLRAAGARRDVGSGTPFRREAVGGGCLDFLEPGERDIVRVHGLRDADCGDGA